MEDKNRASHNRNSKMKKGTQLNTSLDTKCPCKVPEIDISKYEFDKPIIQIPTGFPKFDEMIGGIERSRLVIIAGRAAIGKTSLAVSLANNIAVKRRVPTLFFSLDLSAMFLKERLFKNICYASNVIKNEEDKEQLFKKGEVLLGKSPLFIDDRPQLSMDDFRIMVQNKVKECGVRIVIVDYLQLINSGARFDNPKEEMSIIMKSLRDIANELDITIVICSMLRHRAAYEKQRPDMSVLRKSCGNIDQYADVVALIHRPEYYKIGATEDAIKGIAELIVCKNERGKTDMFLMGFDRNSRRFFNYNNDIENHLKEEE